LVSPQRLQTSTSTVTQPPIPSTSRDQLPVRPQLPLDLPSPFSSSSSIEPVTPSAFLPPPRSPRHASSRNSSPVSSAAPSSTPSSIFDLPSASSRSSRHSSSDTIHRPAPVPSQYNGSNQSSSHSSGSGAPSSGMGRKASVSLQLFKETTRSGVAGNAGSSLATTEEGGVGPEGRRHLLSSPSKSRNVSGTSSYKGKEREMLQHSGSHRSDRTIERLYSDSATISYASPLVSPDHNTIISPIPRPYSTSRPSSRPPSRLSTASPSHSNMNITSPSKSSYRDVYPPHSTAQPHPPLHSHNSYFGQPHHHHPFPNGISSSRPASPHLTPSFSQYSPTPSPRTSLSTGVSATASPVPELAAAPIAEGLSNGLGLGEPALPLPISTDWTTSPVDERGEDEMEASVKGERTLTGRTAQEEESSLEKALAGLEVREDFPTPSSSVPSSTLSAPPSQPTHALKLLYSPRMSHDRSVQLLQSPPPLSNTHSSHIADLDLHSLHASDNEDDDEDEDEQGSHRLSHSVVVSIAGSRSHSRAGHRRRDHSRSSTTADDTDDESGGAGDAQEYDSWTGSTSSSEDWSESSSSSTEDEDETEEDDWSTSSITGVNDARRRRGGSLESLDVGEEEEYEVDVGPLQERLDQNGGGEVSMRREAGREDDWKGHLIGSDGKRSGTIPLEPYRHQVGGHNHIFKFSKKAVCKVRFQLLRSLVMLES